MLMIMTLSSRPRWRSSRSGPLPWWASPVRDDNFGLLTVHAHDRDQVPSARDQILDLLLRHFRALTICPHDREHTSSTRDYRWSYLQVVWGVHDREQAPSAHDFRCPYLWAGLGRSWSALTIVSTLPQLVTICCLCLDWLWGAHDPCPDREHAFSSRDSMQFEL